MTGVLKNMYYTKVFNIVIPGHTLTKLNTEKLIKIVILGTPIRLFKFLYALSLVTYVKIFKIHQFGLPRKIHIKPKPYIKDYFMNYIYNSTFNVEETFHV